MIGHHDTSCKMEFMAVIPALSDLTKIHPVRYVSFPLSVGWRSTVIWRDSDFALGRYTTARTVHQNQHLRNIERITNWLVYTYMERSNHPSESDKQMPIIPIGIGCTTSHGGFVSPNPDLPHAGKILRHSRGRRCGFS